jgi:enoyl-CoA hydratase
MSESVIRHDAEGVCTLTLNRPDKLNALDTGAFEAIDAHIAALQNDAEKVGCVVLRGAGSQCAW